MQVDVQVYKVQALLLKQLLLPVNVVNNCDGTSTLTASEHTGTLLWNW
jgi:hypothetical protein